MNIHQHETIDHSPLAALRTHPPIPVRWTLLDLIAIAVSTIVLSGLGLAALMVWLRQTAAIEEQRIAIAVGLTGIVYVAALLMTLVWIVGRRRGTWREIGFRSTSPWWVLLVFGMFVVQIVAVVLVNSIVGLIIGGFENPQIDALIDPGGFSWLNFAVVFLVVAIIAPIVEEVIFRGLLYQWLRSRAGVLTAVLLSAALFSAVHVFPPLLPALFVVGLILALAFEWSQSLWVVITLHMLQNGLTVIALYAIQASGLQLPQ